MLPPLQKESSAPSLSYLSLHDTPAVRLINNILTPSECYELVSKYQHRLSSATTNYAQRDRSVFEDEELSSLLYARITKCFQVEKMTDEEGCTWTACGLNPLFRLCRYGPGGYFSQHVDGRRLATVNDQSFMTVNIYLNSVPKEDCGATRILRVEKHSEKVEKSFEMASIQPVQGLPAIFHHALLHDGEALLKGEKYLLRTDLMYTRDVPFEVNDFFRDLSREEKGKKALDLASRLEDANNQAEAIVWYKRAYNFNPDLR